jgi:hypothetical protein
MENVQDIETIEYIPSACKPADDAPAAYAGKITLESPTFEKRFELLEQLADIDADRPNRGKSADDLTPDERKELAKYGMRAIIKCIQLARPFVRSVDIVRISDGKRYQSFDHLSRNSDFDGDLQGLIQVIAKTGALEGKKKPS